MPRKKRPLEKLKIKPEMKTFTSKYKWYIKAAILLIVIAVVAWYLLYY